MSPQEALGLGVISEVLPHDELLPRAWKLAEQLAKKPALSLRYTKTLLTQRLKKALLDDLGYGLSLECLGIAAAMENATA